MTSFASGSRLRDRRFPFKPVRPRGAAALLLAIAGALSYLALNPAVALSGSDHGRRSFIDAILRALPPAGQSLALAALALYFAYQAVTIYLPCIVHDGLVVYDGERLAGFDRIGRTRSMPIGDVRSVAFRAGSAFASGPGATLRIPLSLMRLDGSDESAIRSLLQDAGG